MEYIKQADRTFKTRLLFIKEIFSNKFAQTEILTSSINHKLLKSLENMEATVDKSVKILEDKDPIKVLKKVK